MERPKVAILIPALNEEEKIGSIITAVSSYGTVWVVDDGSKDKTAEIAISRGAYVIKHGLNKGYDEALNSAFSAAHNDGADIFITMDADGQHEASSLKEIISMLSSGNDMVLCVRPKLTRISEKIFAKYTEALYGIKDPLCGLKGYSRSVYESLGYFDSYRSIGTELMIHARKSNFRYSQLYISLAFRNDKSRFGGSVSANLKILRAMVLSIYNKE